MRLASVHDPAGFDWVFHHNDNNPEGYLGPHYMTKEFPDGTSTVFATGLECSCDKDVEAERGMVGFDTTPEGDGRKVVIEHVFTGDPLKNWKGQMLVKGLSSGRYAVLPTMTWAFTPVQDSDGVEFAVEQVLAGEISDIQALALLGIRVSVTPSEGF
jgi:hypothetical protein